MEAAAHGDRIERARAKEAAPFRAPPLPTVFSVGP